MFIFLSKYYCKDINIKYRKSLRTKIIYSYNVLTNVAVSFFDRTQN